MEMHQGAAPAMVGSASEKSRQPFRSWAEDYVAQPTPISRDAVFNAMRRRGIIQRLATRTSNRQDANGARIVVDEHEAAKLRATDPFEAACTFLRRRGYRVCSERLMRPGRAGTRVGRHADLSDREVIALAERLGATLPAAPAKKGTTCDD